VFSVEQRIRDRFEPAILREAAARYGIEEGRTRPLDGFESFIYEVYRDGAPYILRLAHSLRRSEELIEGEIDWINHLAAAGASVARAVPSERGRLVEVIDDGQGGAFLATSFVRAVGKSPWKVGWSPQLVADYGRLLGRMHRLSRGYEPTRSGWRRPHWDDPMLLEADRFLPAADVAILDRYRELLTHLRALPQDSRFYGLIHQDAHGGNMLVDEAGTITLFDFDDCVYRWFANDIAIVLFYVVTGQEDPVGFGHRFLDQFLSGYRTENQLDPQWFREFPQFLKLREIDLYAVIHRSFDVTNLDDPWCARFMDGRKERIESDVPYLELDLDDLG